MSTWENNEEIKIFREYLQIPSVHPDIDYEPCVAFLKKQAQNLGLPLKVYTPGGEKKPIVVITWIGSNPELPSIVLNSHMDVVPVFPNEWKHPPFGAEMDSEGRIFARGSQDMKCVGMQHLAAIRALRKAGIQLKRTIHVTFVPDEELGGKPGMAMFVHTDDFKKLNVGFSLDEGIASATDVYPVYYAERFIIQIHFKISGTTGHGSLLHENTAGVKLNHLLRKMMEFRQEEENKLKNNKNFTIGDVTTINLTQIHGGVQSNVVPPMIEAVFDIRVAVTVDPDALIQKIEKFCEESGGGIEIEFEQKEPKVEPTKIDASNIYWTALKQAFDDAGIKTSTQVFPGATDSRYVRLVGIPAIGFSPMNNTPVLLHDNDEYLKADTYLEGIEIYKKILKALANV
ncbi:aminoacylase-1-like [Eupeodes corollae]|uniref:aminoacylase-1-like n=1 Tax=Eupeodes corollae TaxID=290404 RepID=UPI002492DD74|nr:aminoacylase-1-like [Eupeodes corollae]